MPEALSVIILVSSGFILLIVELLTPGFALPGILGALLIIFGCYNAIQQSLFLGVATSLVSLLVVVLFFRFFRRSSFWKRIRLDAREDKEGGFIPAEDLASLLNKNGVAITALRPAGIALIEGRRVDVAAESAFVEKDKKVKVVRVEGSMVIVKEEL